MTRRLWARFDIADAPCPVPRPERAGARAGAARSSRDRQRPCHRHRRGHASRERSRRGDRRGLGGARRQGSANPRPSAVLAALVASALPAARFTFEGFLPRRGRDRRELIERICGDERTSILFEAPGRAAATLAELAAACGHDRSAALCRELTKMHEETWRGSLGELAARAIQRAAAGRGHDRRRRRAGVAWRRAEHGSGRRSVRRSTPGGRGPEPLVGCARGRPAHRPAAARPVPPADATLGGRSS